jgi:heme oxygenase
MILTHLVSAVQPAITQHNFLGFLFGVNILRTHSDFLGLQWRLQQICFFHETLNCQLAPSQLSATFNIIERTIRQTLLRGRKDLNTRGHHSALDAETESELIAMLLNLFQRGQPMTNKKLLKLLRAT